MDLFCLPVLNPWRVCFAWTPFPAHSTLPWSFLVCRVLFLTLLELPVTALCPKFWFLDFMLTCILGFTKHFFACYLDLIKSFVNYFCCLIFDSALGFSFLQTVTVIITGNILCFNWFWRVMVYLVHLVFILMRKLFKRLLCYVSYNLINVQRM